MYTRPNFIRVAIEPTTEVVQYPPPGTTEHPALPLVVYPEFLGDSQPHAGPKRIVLRPFVDGGQPVPDGALATLYQIDRDGSLRIFRTLFNCYEEIELAGAYVIKTHDDLTTPVGWEVIGYSETAQQAD